MNQDAPPKQTTFEFFEKKTVTSDDNIIFTQLHSVGFCHGLINAFMFVALEKSNILYLAINASKTRMIDFESGIEGAFKVAACLALDENIYMYPAEIEMMYDNAEQRIIDSVEEAAKSIQGWWRSPAVRHSVGRLKRMRARNQPVFDTIEIGAPGLKRRLFSN